jgi:hypothetical protein
MRKVLISLLILVGIYFGSLHPWSGCLGGFIFYVSGWAIPTVVNVLISYLFSFYCTGRMRPVFKGLLFITISFGLGVNTKILDIMPVRDTVGDITILKPLHIFPLPTLYIKKPETLELKSSSFESFGIGGDEWCMCLYFVPPFSLLDASLGVLSGTVENQKAAAYTQAFDPKDADYQILYQAKVEGEKVFLETTLRDKVGGHIIIKTVYPKSLLFVDVFEHIDREKRLSSKYFWPYAASMLLNDTVWRWLFTYLTTYDPPVKMLFKLKKETYLLSQ